MENFKTFLLNESLNADDMQLDAQIDAIEVDLGNLTTSRKQNAVIAAKYGIEATKVADIKKAMIDLQLDLHRQKKSNFTDKDYKLFYKATGNPSIKSKLFPILEKEPRKFIEDVLFPKMISYAGRTWKVGRSDVGTFSEKTYFKEAKLIEEFLNMTSEAGVQKQMNDKLLYESLDTMLKEFHENYIEKIMERAEKQFDNFKKEYSNIDWNRLSNTYDANEYILELYPEYQKEWDEINQKEDEARAKRDWYELDKIEKERKLSNVNTKKEILANSYIYFEKFNKNVFLKRVNEEAENKYKHNLLMIIDRINKTNMDKSSIDVEYISEIDAKAFDIYISDGEKKFHARSIFAAENSKLVTPHWRFIITSAK